MILLKATFWDAMFSGVFPRCSFEGEFLGDSTAQLSRPTLRGRFKDFFCDFFRSLGEEDMMNTFFWVVVSNICYCHPYPWGNDPI